MATAKQAAGYQRHLEAEYLRTLDFPEGEGFIKTCTKCDEPILLAYVGGMMLSLSTKSVPVNEAVVLVKYNCGFVYAVWRSAIPKPVKFIITEWFPKLNDPYKPDGSLHIGHICKLRR